MASGEATGRPATDPSAFVAPGAVIRGDVTIGVHSSVWFHAVIRGDEGPVSIGAYSNVQDCCVLHSDLGVGTEIGSWVTIGHGAVVRGARIGDRVMVGMNATIMTGAIIGDGSIVGAAAFIPYRTEFPPHSLIFGNPARLIRPLEEWEQEQHRIACETYLRLAEEYRSGKW